jgi:hypothetical protein
MKVQHPQVQQDRRQTLTEFTKEGELKLKHGERYMLTDMAVTSDNKLLLCDYSQKGSIGYTTLIKDKQNKIHSIEN